MAFQLDSKLLVGIWKKRWFYAPATPSSGRPTGTDAVPLLIRVRACQPIQRSAVPPAVPNEGGELAPSFDMLVGSLLRNPRHFEAKRLGGLEVDDEFESRGLLDR